MNAIQKLLLCCLAGSVCPGYLRAQPSSYTGCVTYQADTVRRLEPHPAAYLVTRLLVYQQGESTRLEVWSVNRRNPTDTNKAIHLRNREGTYTWIEYSDPLRAATSNFVLFVGYEVEKRQQAQQALSPLHSGYQLAKVLQRVQWLGLPAERIALSKGAPQESVEAVMTQAIHLPLGALFPSIRSLPGTPLQFTESESGWLTQYTATALSTQPSPKALFIVNPHRKVLRNEEAMQLLSAFD